MTDAAPPPPPFLTFDLSLIEKGRPVFTAVSFALASTGLGVVCGSSGSGRSSILLAAVGRLRGVTGSGRFDGLDLIGEARAVRRRTAVARVSDLIDLEPQLLVDESIMERSLIEGVSSMAAERAVRRAESRMQCVFPRTALIADLSRLDQGRLALALAGVRESDLIIFDDVDRGLGPDDQRRLYEAMTAATAAGTAVLASTTTALTVPDHAVVVTVGDQEN